MTSPPLRGHVARDSKINIRKVAATATSWRSPRDKKDLQEDMALVEDWEKTPTTTELFMKVNQLLLQLVLEGKISGTSLHNKVKI